MYGRRQEEALAAIGAEIENVRTAWNWAAEHGKVRELGRFLETLRQFYVLRSLFQEGWEAMGAAVVGLKAKGRLGKKGIDLLACLLAGQATFCRRLGQFGAAAELLRESLSLCSGRRAQKGRALVMMEMGLGAALRGAPAEGKRCFHEALVLWQEMRNSWGIATTLNYLGAAESDLGEYDKARQLYEESLDLCRKSGDRYGVASSLNSLGTVAAIQGEYGEARRLLREAMEAHREIGNQDGVAIALMNLGRLAFDLKEFDEAHWLLEKGLTSFQGIGNCNGMGNSLYLLALVMQQVGEYDKARQFLEEALDLFLETGERADRAGALANLAILFSKEGEQRKAWDCLYEALAVVKDSPVRHTLLTVLIGAARVEAAAGKSEQTVELLAAVLNHPACSRAAKEEAQEVLSGLQPRPTPEVIARALERSETKGLEEVVDALLAERPPGHG